MTRPAGLQPERTALAWSRTSLVMCVNALLVLRSGMQRGDTILLGLGIVLCGVSVGLLVTGRYRSRELATTPRAPRAPVVWCAAASVVLAALAAGVTLLD